MGAVQGHAPPGVHPRPVRAGTRRAGDTSVAARVAGPAAGGMGALRAGARAHRSARGRTAPTHASDGPSPGAHAPRVARRGPPRPAGPTGSEDLEVPPHTT